MTKVCGFILFSFIVLFNAKNLQAQEEIHFGDYHNYSATLLELGAGGLDFGPIITGEGQKSISLSEAKVISIKGIKYLDIIVSITADQYLKLTPACSDPSCRIPFTLQAAYANKGSNTIGEARFFTVTANSAAKRFPILRREGMPPGPPPTPPHKEFNPALYMETAYIYLYGSVNVGNVNAGSYSGNITVTVIYD